MALLIEYVSEKAIGDVWEEEARCMDVVNIAFGHVVNGRVTWNCPECKEGLRRLRSIHPGIKILLSIGGWGSGGFSEIAYTQEGRTQFARDSLALVEEYGLDGIDIDWEYPGIAAAGIGADKADKENFTLLLKTLREAFEDRQPGRYMLTIAAGGDSYYVRNTQMEEAVKYLDYVQIMTYDLRGGFQTLTGHHTSLYADRDDLFDASVDKAVKIYKEAGVPAEKIVIGAAFYSRKWEHVPDYNHGLCQQAQTIGGYGEEYGGLVEKYINKNGFVRYWDDEAKAPWLFNGSVFISYDDEQSLACKISYLKENGLAGIMCWEYIGDATHTLTAFMRKELER